jgi:hypothetical protein
MAAETISATAVLDSFMQPPPDTAMSETANRRPGRSSADDGLVTMADDRASGIVARKPRSPEA